MLKKIRDLIADYFYKHSIDKKIDAEELNRLYVLDKRQKRIIDDYEEFFKNLALFQMDDENLPARKERFKWLVYIIPTKVKSEYKYDKYDVFILLKRYELIQDDSRYSFELVMYDVKNGKDACKINIDVNDENLYISNLITEEEYRRKGLARFALKYVFDYAKIFNYEKYKKIYGRILPNTPTGIKAVQNFYRSCGFEVKGLNFYKKF